MVYRYRKYEGGLNICNIGDDGLEFYVILNGTAGVLVPKQVEEELTPSELYEYIKEKNKIILWDESNSALLELFLVQSNI